MRQSKYITIITMACALFFASCSDEYMENMNTDPSKAATIDPNAQLFGLCQQLRKVAVSGKLL